MNRPVWLIVLLYAAFATLWIVAFGYLISPTFDDPVLRSRAYLLQELILIAVSGVLLYLLLKFQRDPMITSGTADAGADSAHFQVVRLIPMCAALALVAPLVGFGIVKIYGPQLERDAYA
ncbi:MAG: GGDEF domain-containing protein, partial [Nitrosospira sp.]|nr:GGDEF domain-containing protein [Nitrosospira sp.]